MTPLTTGELPAPKKVLVKDLNLDPQNPRLAGLELTVDQQDEIIKNLWQDLFCFSRIWKNPRFGLV